MSNATQDHRPLKLETALGKDVLLLRTLDGEEALGELFHYTLGVLSTRPDLDADALLGKAATVTFTDQAGSSYLTGIVSAFCQTDFVGTGGEVSDYYGYRLELRPSLWRLTLNSHCRFYHDQSVVDIIKSILADYGIEADSTSLQTGQYPKLDHCVQYNESDYVFLCRLLEREGLYYFYRHNQKREQLVLADAPGAHKPLPHAGTLSCGDYRNALQVACWQAGRALSAGVSRVNAFDLEKPTSSLQQGLVARASRQSAAQAELQCYHDGYRELKQGERYARIALEAQAAAAEQIDAQCGSLQLAPGGCFTLQGHPNRAFNTDYLVTAARYQADNTPYRSTDATLRPPQCTFRAQPKAVPFRLAQRTPRPHPAGPQTAQVIGQPDGSIAVDKLGRIQVLFNWEQFDPPPGNRQSQRCWVRVAQSWAGKGWGTVLLPRAGQEVIVDFVNGDIDQPIVVGSVYNQNNLPPYKLPANGAVSTWHSRSTSGNGYNELRFIDTQGKEQVFLHAEKDWKTYTRHDTLHWTGNDALGVVEHDERRWIKHDRHTRIDGKQIEQVNGTHHRQVGGAGYLKVDGDYHLNVGGAHKQQATGQLSLQSGMALALQAGTALGIKGLSVSVNGETAIVLEADVAISLKVGGSFVSVTPAGVSISGPIVQLNGAGAAAAGVQVSAQGPGSPEAPETPQLGKQDDGSAEILS